MNSSSQLTFGIIAPNRWIAAFLYALDRVGTLLRPRRKRPERIDSLLIVFFGSFGDGLMFTSILRSLRQQMPDARIDVVVSNDVAAILKGCPYVSNLFATDMPSGKKYPSRVRGLVTLMRSLGTRYDIALCPRAPVDNGILPLFLSRASRYTAGFSTGGFSFCLDLVAPWRSGIHETEHFLDLVQSICPSCQLSRQELFYDRETVRRSLDEKSAMLGIPPSAGFVVVHPGSKVMKRSLSPDRWRQVLTDLLEGTNQTIVVTGVASEEAFYDLFAIDNARIVPTFGRFNIPELTELLGRATSVVTVETFVAHLAGIAGVPAVAFWTGVTDVRQWRPAEGQVEVLSVNPPCSPCFRWCETPICMDHDASQALEVLALRKAVSTTHELVTTPRE